MPGVNITPCREFQGAIPVLGGDIQSEARRRYKVAAYLWPGDPSGSYRI